VKNISHIKNELDEISTSFCAAKWQQVTLHLQNGHTHSCHHPQTHKIPLEEIDKDPSALHNTEYKKQQRKMMLEGKRPDECSYCWKVEDTEGVHFSDRIKKSSSSWARNHIQTIAKQEWNHNTVPTHVEVSFSNVCNMKCVYCSPVFSSEWWSEINQHGPYPTSDQFNNLDWIAETGRTPYLKRENNPYIDAWWKWWPDIRSKLHVLRVTGGEPFLSKDTSKLIKDIETGGCEQMELHINSNLQIPFWKLNSYMTDIADLKENQLIKDAKIFTSCDTHGEQAEYIREGMEYDTWLKNCKKVLKRGISLHIMVTANVLSIDSMKLLMADIYRLKQDYKAVTYGVSILHSPKFLNVLNLPKTNYWIDKFDELVEYVSDNPLTENNELNYIQRLRNYFVNNTVTDSDFVKNRLDCVKFISEINTRRNKNFTNTFPNYKFLIHT